MSGDEFGVAQHWIDRVAVLSVSGAVDMLSAPALTEAITAALSAEPAGLIVDLSNVEFLASAGMSVLISAHEQAAPAVRFGVVADGPATSRPIKLVGIDSIIDLYATLDEATGAFSDA